MEDDRPGDARPGKGGLGTLPRRLRSLLHAPSRRSRRAQGGVGREPGEEGSAVREGRSAGRVDRLGARPRRDHDGCRPNGRRSARSRRADPRRSGSGSAPRATVLRALRAAPRHRARANASRRARRSCAELEALAVASRVEPRPTRAPPRIRRRLLARSRCAARWQQELAARGVDRERAARARSSGSPRRSRAVARRAGPQAFAGTDLDPDANRKRMEALVKRDGGARGIARRARAAASRRGAVADDPAGGDAEGSAGGEHDRRQGRRRQPAARRARKKCVRRRRAGRASVRCPTRRGARSPIASSARFQADQSGADRQDGLEGRAAAAPGRAGTAGSSGLGQESPSCRSCPSCPYLPTGS